MQTSDPPAEGAPPAAPSESTASAAPPGEASVALPGALPGAVSEAVASAARSAEEANGPAIEMGLETVDLSAAEERAVAEAEVGSGASIGLPLDLAEAERSRGAPAVGETPEGGTRPENKDQEILVGASGPEYRPSGWFMGVVAFVVAAIDLGSKEWAKWALAGPELRRSSKHIEVIPGHLDFIFAQNPGGAWSFLRSMPDGLRRPFFLFVSSAAIVFIVTVYLRLEKRQWAMRWGLPLALGGAIGNLVDRIRYGWVCDFIDAYYKGGANEVHWPTFNPADVAIVVGVGLMALDLLSLRKSSPPSAAPTVEATGGAA